MEVSFENDGPPVSSATIQTTIQGQRRSASEKHKATPSEWLPLFESGSANIHRRLDLPRGDSRDDRADDSPSLSVYGHCAPMPVEAPLKTEASRDILPVRPCDSDCIPSNRERLLRLMEAQQAWYDYHQQAAAQAAEMLILVEHHQSQWIH